MSNRNTTNLSDLDNLLAELDEIEDPKRRSSIKTAPVDSSSDSSPPPPPPPPRDAPSSSDSTPAWESASSSSSSNSAPKRASAKLEEELDNLVAKFDQLDNSPKKPRDSIPPPPPASSNSNRQSVPPPPPSNRESMSVPREENKRMSVYNPRPANSSGVCAGCGQQVSGEHILALGQMWHPHHFSCSNCGNGIKGEFYETEGNKKVCRNCADSMYRCAKCGQAITGEYFLGNGQMFHQHCLDRHNCATCGGQITTSSMIAMDKHYHPDCFTCTSCHVKLGTSFYNKNGMPHCANCSGGGSNSSGGGGVRCHKCSQPISGQYVAYEGKSYHQGCFNCHYCYKQLNYDSFYNSNGVPACYECASSH